MIPIKPSRVVCIDNGFLIHNEWPIVCVPVHVINSSECPIERPKSTLCMLQYIFFVFLHALLFFLSIIVIIIMINAIFYFFWCSFYYKVDKLLMVFILHDVHVSICLMVPPYTEGVLVIQRFSGSFHSIREYMYMLNVIRSSYDSTLY